MVDLSFKKKHLTEYNHIYWCIKKVIPVFSDQSVGSWEGAKGDVSRKKGKIKHTIPCEGSSPTDYRL